MKLKPGTLLYTMIRDSLAHTLTRTGQTREFVDQWYTESKLSDTRKLWDMFNASGMMGQFYSHAGRDVEDSHIETAMRHIWPSL